MKGLVFVDDAGVEISESFDELKTLLEPFYVNVAPDEVRMNELKEAAQKYFAERDASVRVEIPAQEIADGILQIAIVQPPLIKGFVLIDDPESLIEDRSLKEVAGIEVQGAQLPGSLDELKVALEPYLGVSVEELRIDDLKEAISQYCKERQEAPILVVIPAQEVVDGVLQVAVLNPDPTIRIKSVVLSGDSARFREVKSDGIEFVDLQIPGDFSSLEQDLAPYLNKPFEEVTFQQIQEVIAAHYAQEGVPVPRISITEKDADAGLVLISVVEQPPEKPGMQCLDNPLMIEKTKGLVLVDCEEHLLDTKTLRTVEGLCVQGLTIPGRCQKLEERLNKIYLGRPLDFEKIQEIKKTIYEYYEAQYDPFVLVLVPQQNLSYNVLQVLVIKARLQDIRTEGNEWFSDKRLMSYIKTKRGEEIKALALQKDLNALNRNPFRRVNAVYAPGSSLGCTDLILSTQDRFPFKIYSGADNTGILTIGRQRLFAGFTWGKAFGLDHLLTYQYTTSYNFHTFQAHTAQYMVPLPWNHALNFYGGYSTTYPHLPAPSFRREGSSTQISARYTMPLQSRPDTTQEISVGFDYKNTNTSLFFTEIIQPNASSYVNLSQFVFEYKRNLEKPSYRIDMEASLFYSPGELLNHETTADYSSLRPGAKSDYVYAKGLFRYLLRMPKEFTMNLWLRGQLASQNLLPSEQFGIGGYDTVRGYDERQLTMDMAFLSSLEFRTPPFSFISFIRRHPIKDALQFLAFVDYGYGKNHNLYPGEPLASYLLGIGPGLRYTLDPYVSLRLDYGFKLHHEAVFTGVDGLVHFNLTASY
jgi:hemolysin activation/secretion protein